MPDLLSWIVSQDIRYLTWTQLTSTVFEDESEVEKEARSSFKEEEKKDAGEIVSSILLYIMKWQWWIGANKKTGSNLFAPSAQSHVMARVERWTWQPTCLHASNCVRFCYDCEKRKSLSESVVRFITYVHPLGLLTVSMSFLRTGGYSGVVLNVFSGVGEGFAVFSMSSVVCDCWTPRELLPVNWSICSSSCQVLSSTGLLLQLGCLKRAMEVAVEIYKTTKSIWWCFYEPYTYFLYTCSSIRIFSLFRLCIRRSCA